MTQEIISAAKKRMSKAVEALKHELSKLRTGRANPGLLEHISVDCYDSQMPLNQVATVAVVDARTLSVTPWDKSLLHKIEKSILTAELGLNPVTAGDVIRVPLPVLTEERRKELVKLVKESAEMGRVAVRQARRDANTELKNQEKDKLITEDELRSIENEIQKMTDRFNHEIDELIAHKEKDLMEV